MASGSSGQQSFRDAIRAIMKDSTSVGTPKLSSEYKSINASILKCTNHVEFLPKEKHVRIILAAVSGSRPRADVAYCIHALQNRLVKTQSWVVALKTLIIIHRALREVDNSFLEELSYHSQHRGHILNLLHFKDDSNPSACDYSSWIRTYALYIEECLQCFRVLKYDFYRDHTRTKKLETPALLEHLPALQQLLFRLVSCQPVGAARYNYMVQYALSIVAAESVRLYVAITDGVLILVDKFFEMQRGEAVPALEIYRRAVKQAHKLSDFFEMCRSLEFGQTQKYVKIEQPPASFLTAMEDYVKDAPQPLMLPWTSNNDDERVTPKLIAIHNTEQGSESSDDCEETTKSNKVDVVAPPLIIPDLLSCWDEPSQEAMAAPVEESSNTTNTVDSSEAAATGWELALSTTPPSHAPPLSLCMGGVVNRSVLDSLYETAVTRKPSANAINHTRKRSSNPFEAGEYVYDENMFYSGYNHNMMYYPSLVAHQSFMQVPQTYQHQNYQDQSMVVYDYMQMPGIHQQQPPVEEQQQESWSRASHVSSKPPTEENPVAGHRSTISFGNPFMEQPQKQPSTFSLL
ncbi:hypothetical protein C2S51_002857 [Perilla frutescens var. frutescens]|nr:hypothetical protein C2S51_002857 [Perilla frutescens var. frutescens]